MRLHKLNILGICMVILLGGCSSPSSNAPCGGGGMSSVPAAPNNALIKATVLNIRSSAGKTFLDLYITESHYIDNEGNWTRPNTQEETIAQGQMPDLSINDTITAFASVDGDECGSSLYVSRIVKVPTTTAGVPDTLSFTMSNLSGTVTNTTCTEGSHDAQGYLDPDLISYLTGSTQTRIQLHSGGTYTQGATLLTMDIGGTSLQSYPLGTAGPGNSISYSVYDTQNQPYTGYYSATSGTITLTGTGNVGDKITGTFDAVVSKWTNTADAFTISGAFSVTREN